eukprot:COSAG04_NODE_6415_length_1332_cov_1.905921_2_plen_54_part_00
MVFGDDFTLKDSESQDMADGQGEAVLKFADLKFFELTELAKRDVCPYLARFFP